MTRFRPTVEVLDARTLPSVMFAASADPSPTVPFATRPLDDATEPVAPADGALAAGKVRATDFHFTHQANKSSPLLIL